MLRSGPGPFARPAPGFRIKRGAPTLRRPTPEEIDSFPAEAVRVLEETWSAQEKHVGEGRYHLDWVQGRHFLLAGATGAGLGGALAVCLLHLLHESGSLTVIGRDLTRSLGYETGLRLTSLASDLGCAARFRWLNCGVALAGSRLEEVVKALKEVGADSLIYVNTVAAASSGLLPGLPPVFVKDVDEAGVFQWELLPLDPRSLEATRHVMGTLAVEFPRVLEGLGIRVAASAFADYRGSLDLGSRNPDLYVYGRQGAYSTSLYLPKDVIQEAVSAAFGTGRIMVDVFFPLMETRALGMIPGGVASYHLHGRLLQHAGIRRVPKEELALCMLDRIGRAVLREDDDPFPRLDTHEISLDLYFWELVERLSLNESSDFFYRRWLPHREEDGYGFAL